MSAEPAAGKVKVTIPVEPAVAEVLLRDEALRAWVGRFASHLLSRPSGLADGIAGTDLTAEFRAFRNRRTLDGSKPKDLITEGRDGGPRDGA